MGIVLRLTAPASATDPPVEIGTYVITDDTTTSTLVICYTQVGYGVEKPYVGTATVILMRPFPQRLQILPSYGPKSTLCSAAFHPLPNTQSNLLTPLSFTTLLIRWNFRLRISFEPHSVCYPLQSLFQTEACR